jgi:hypothetical protein
MVLNFCSCVSCIWGHSSSKSVTTRWACFVCSSTAPHGHSTLYTRCTSQNTRLRLNAVLVGVASPTRKGFDHSDESNWFPSGSCAGKIPSPSVDGNSDGILRLHSSGRAWSCIRRHTVPGFSIHNNGSAHHYSICGKFDITFFLQKKNWIKSAMTVGFLQRRGY